MNTGYTAIGSSCFSSLGVNHIAKIKLKNVRAPPVQGRLSVSTTWSAAHGVPTAVQRGRTIRGVSLLQTVE